jgi:hypothetical protein
MPFWQDYKSPEDVIGQNRLLKQRTKALVELALQAVFRSTLIGNHIPLVASVAFQALSVKVLRMVQQAARPSTHKTIRCDMDPGLLSCCRAVAVSHRSLITIEPRSFFAPVEDDLAEQLFRFAYPRDIAKFISLVRHMRFSRSQNNGRWLPQRFAQGGRIGEIRNNLRLQGRVETGLAAREYALHPRVFGCSEDAAYVEQGL